jgi:hypothetical protein
MTKVQRDEAAQKAVALSAQGLSYQRIAASLEVTWKTARKLVADELAVRAEHREKDTERHLAVYDAIQEAAWERFEETDNRSLNSSGFLNTIKAAEDSKVKITGAEAPTRSDNRHQHEHHDFTNTPTEELIELEYYAQRVFGESGTQAR